MAYQLDCPFCQHRVNSSFVRVGAVVRCPSCDKKFRIQESHVMRSISPQAKPEYVQAIHKQAESGGIEEPSSLSGLSDLMQREAAPPNETRGQDPLPAAQRKAAEPPTTHKPNQPPAQAGPNATASNPSPNGGERGATNKRPVFERLRRLLHPRSRWILIAAGSGAIFAVAILAMVFWPVDSRPASVGEPTDRGGVAPASDVGNEPAVGRDAEDRTTAPGEATDAAPAAGREDAADASSLSSEEAASRDAGEDVADLMGITGEQVAGKKPREQEPSVATPPIDPAAARPLRAGQWQRVDPPTPLFEVMPERPGRVRVTSAQWNVQPEAGVVVSVDFVNRSSRTAAVVEFSAAALHGGVSDVIARRRAAFALMEAGETHTVTLPLPARFADERLRVEAWVDASVVLSDAWRALDPRIETASDPDRSETSMRITLTNGGMRRARGVLASVRALDGQGNVIRNALLHWTVDAEPMDRVMLSAAFPTTDANAAAPSQYDLRAYLLPTAEPPPRVFSRTGSPEADERPLAP